MKPRPIRNIYPSRRYVSSFRKLDPQIQQRLIIRERLFRQDAYYPGLKTHQLEGDLGNKGFLAYYVDENVRVMFTFVSADEVLYIDVGDHGIYRI